MSAPVPAILLSAGTLYTVPITDSGARKSVRINVAGTSWEAVSIYSTTEIDASFANLASSVAANTDSIAAVSESLTNHAALNLSAHGATSANSAQRIVARDVNGDFAARIITATTFAGGAALTGTPTAPTAAGGTNTTQIASTAFVRGEVAALVASAPAALDTLNEFAVALGNDPNFATTTATSIGTKLAKASNLSDVANVVTARTNLGVYSTTVVDGIITIVTASITSHTSDTDNPHGATSSNVAQRIVTRDLNGDFAANAINAAAFFGPGTSLTGIAVLASANTFTTAQQINRNAIAATPTDGLVVRNTTAATVGTTVQMSPRILLGGAAWKSNSTAASQPHDWTMDMLPVSGPVSTSSTLRVRVNPNAAGYSDAMLITSAGDATFLGSVVVTAIDRASNSPLAVGTSGLTAAGTRVAMATGTISGASFAQRAVSITPTYNQSGTGAGTDLLINRTETAIGSGPHYLVDAQVGGSSKFSADRTGYVESIGHMRSLAELNTFARASASSISVTAGSFFTVPLGTANENAGGNYNNSTYLYTVPVTGWYFIRCNFRITDNYTNDISYGIGAHTSNADGTWFTWHRTNPVRNGSQNIRVSYFTAGDQIRMYCYVANGTGSVAVENAEMVVYLLHKG